MEIAVFVFLTLLVVAYVGYPIIEARTRAGLWKKQDTNHRAIELEERKAALYAAIKDIEFDYEMGKLSEEDFQELRQQYKQEAINLLKKIDQIKGRRVSAKTAQRGKRRAGKKGSRYCWICGTAVTETDKFCANCGNKLK